MDYSACILNNGHIEYMIEDERLTRIKHSKNNHGPQAARCEAAEYCLKNSGYSVDDMDYIVGNDIIHPFYYIKYRDRIKLFNHHLTHAASAYYLSPFKDAAILVIDAVGSFNSVERRERETITFYQTFDNEIVQVGKVLGKYHQKQSEWECENSLGRMYKDVTKWIGLGDFGEGKTMGLASYGTDKYVTKLYEYYSVNSDGQFTQTTEQKKKLFELITTIMGQSNNNHQTAADIAYAIQFHLTRSIVVLCRYLHELTGLENLCYAGGVALNGAANYKILEDTPFKNIFIPPAPGDAGTCLGAALYAYHAKFNFPRTITNKPFSPYLGKEYGNDDYIEAFGKYSDTIEAEWVNNIYEKTSRLLSENSIVGWFQGRSEIGPRALGNRSILADARSIGMKDIINLRIKHREAFRPFAPIVLEDQQQHYFQLFHSSYYMLMVCPTNEGRSEEIPAVVHVDNTARVQSVNKENNPNLYKLLNHYYRLTGIPVLLNTSFNDNEEPIVEKPEDAISCFLKTNLDFLVMGNYIVKRKEKRYD